VRNYRIFVVQRPSSVAASVADGCVLVTERVQMT
jgi:hypothetical protein